jgi:hypothetical protein
MLPFRSVLLLLVLLPSLGPSLLRAENWPAWRGATGRGISTEENLPLRWSASRNVRWKVPLPEPGNSTPIVWEQHVFLTQALEGGKRRALIAFQRSDGKKLWQREVPCHVQETTPPRRTR